MATILLKKDYRCSDDCQQAGCPGHTATLDYQSSSDGYLWDNGRGRVVSMQRGELEALIDLLKELSEIRCDSLSI